jgi:hypothetical protein
MMRSITLKFVSASAGVLAFCLATSAEAGGGKIRSHLVGKARAGSYPQKVLDTGTQVAWDAKANTCTVPTGLAAGSTVTGAGIYNVAPYLEWSGGGTYVASGKDLTGYGLFVDGGSTTTITGSIINCGTSPSTGYCNIGNGAVNTSVDGGQSAAGIGHLIIDHSYVDMTNYHPDVNEFLRGWDDNDTIEINYSCVTGIQTDAWQGNGTLLVTGSYLPSFGISPTIDYSTHVELFQAHGDAIIQDSRFAQEDGTFHPRPGGPDHFVCITSCTYYGGMTGQLYIDTAAGKTATVLIQRNIFTNDGNVRYPLVIHGPGTTHATIKNNLIQAGYDGFYTELVGLIGTCTDGGGNRDYNTGLPITVCFIFLPFAPRRRRYEAANDNGENQRRIAT